MYEFDSVSVSTYEASSLTAKLTEKSADGWDVVAIVPAGSEVTAFLRRASTAAADAAVAETTTAAETAEPVAATVGEPAGWGSAPESSGSTWGAEATSTSSWESAATSTPADTATSGWGSSSATSAPAATPTAPATPSVPAGWYADPAGRYELRYWDGSAWTEHVSRAGQQFTDPPVA